MSDTRDFRFHFGRSTSSPTEAGAEQTAAK